MKKRYDRRYYDGIMNGVRLDFREIVVMLKQPSPVSRQNYSQSTEKSCRM